MGIQMSIGAPKKVYDKIDEDELEAEVTEINSAAPKQDSLLNYLGEINRNISCCRFFEKKVGRRGRGGNVAH